MVGLKFIESVIEFRYNRIARFPLWCSTGSKIFEESITLIQGSRHLPVRKSLLDRTFGRQKPTTHFEIPGSLNSLSSAQAEVTMLKKGLFLQAFFCLKSISFRIRL